MRIVTRSTWLARTVIPVPAVLPYFWAFPRDVWIKLRHGSRSYVCKDLLDLSDDDEQTAVVDKMVDKDYNLDKDRPGCKVCSGQYTGEAHLFFEQIRNMRRTRDGGCAWRISARGDRIVDRPNAARCCRWRRWAQRCTGRRRL